MASIKCYTSFTKPVAFTVLLLTLTFCLDAGVDTRHSGVDTSYFCCFRLRYEQIDNDSII